MAREAERRGRDTDRDAVGLVARWIDGGVGVSTLFADEDPLTSLALTVREVKELADTLENQYRVWTVSSGWAPRDTLPSVAEVAVEGGETWTIPVISFQAAGGVSIGHVGRGSAPEMSIPGTAGSDNAPPVGTRPMCGTSGWSSGGASGVELRASLSARDGEIRLDLSAWHEDAAQLPRSLTVPLVVDGVAREVVDPFDPEVTAVFGIDVDFARSLRGEDLAAVVKLQGPAKKKGKRATLSKGWVRGAFANDEDGELILAPVATRADLRKGDILIGGEPIGIERTTDREQRTHGSPRTSGPEAYPVGGHHRRQSAVATRIAGGRHDVGVPSAEPVHVAPGTDSCGFSPPPRSTR